LNQSRASFVHVGWAVLINAILGWKKRPLAKVKNLAKIRGKGERNIP
jgi:hypothetical protein